MHTVRHHTIPILAINMKFTLKVLSLSILIANSLAFTIRPNNNVNLAIPIPTRINTVRSSLHQSKSDTNTDTNTATPPTSTLPLLPEIKLYNSLTLQKEPFKTLLPNTVSMYTCGPTVYDHAHVGNFRAFLTYDILKRALLYFGYTVDHICNLTDVDDKIINKCTTQNISLKELTDKYTNFFFDDLEALNIIKAREYPKATEHIEEMVELIQMLEENGLAYQSEEGSWYFNVEKKKGYGQQLVKLDVKGMKSNASGIAGKQRTTGDGDDNDTGDEAGEEAGTDNTDTTDNTHTDNSQQEDVDMDADEYDADKVGARDFALWKAYKPKFDREDATWDTPIGKGRPGWHLECSAMARKYLGDTIDVHCGGIDLKFPHHENEIAQSEGATGKTFCACWLHNGFVNIGSGIGGAGGVGDVEEKMSKSKGNFLTLRGACPGSDDVRAYRYLVVSSQYRNPLSFTEAAMGAAKGALKRMDQVVQQLDNVLKEHDQEQKQEEGGSSSDGTIAAAVQKELSNFEAALADDLSMPRAAASLFGVVKAAETEFKRFKKETKGDADTTATPLDLNGLAAAKAAILQMDKVFGVFYEVPKEKNDDGTEKEEEIVDDSIPEEVMVLVMSRTAAKDAKDWDGADSLRGQITELGFAVKDVKGGEPIVTRI